MRRGTWEYRARVYGRGRRVYAEVIRCLTPCEYDEPIVRAWEERFAESQLRQLEGVNPDEPLEIRGWRWIAFAD